MSRFLAPIHTWLFNKIKLHEQLEKDLQNAFIDKFGNDIEAMISSSENVYGAPLEDMPLEDLIDTNNIHGWLQNRISITETRNAALLAKVFVEYGDAAKEIAVVIYSEQGKICGSDANSEYDLSSAPEIYTALNNYILEGMPCDNVNSVKIKEDDKLQWETSRCLHRGYWEEAGADINTLYKLRETWVRSFVENANTDFTYDLSVVQINGNNTFVHQIMRK